MLIGTFGDITFEVSAQKVLTLDDFSRSSKANFAEHNVINSPAYLEFTGRELDEIKFKVKLHRGLGITDLLAEVHKFREKLWNGTPEFFILNGHLYTENKMVLTDLSEEVNFFDGKGRHVVTELRVSLKEYVEKIFDERS